MSFNEISRRNDQSTRPLVFFNPENKIFLKVLLPIAALIAVLYFIAIAGIAIFKMELFSTYFQEIIVISLAADIFFLYLVVIGIFYWSSYRYFQEQNPQKALTDVEVLPSKNSASWAYFRFTHDDQTWQVKCYLPRTANPQVLRYVGQKTAATVYYNRCRCPVGLLLGQERYWVKDPFATI